MITFPFWIVSPRTVPSPVQEVEGCAAVGIPLAFSDSARMVAYFESQGAKRWDVRYVARNSGIEAFADLHDSGHASICMDPEIDGSGGHEITLAELIIELRGET
jgi:hypothetical protein